VSEPGLTNPWEPWQQLIDSIGQNYRTQLLAARDRARGELRDLDEEQLETVAAKGRRVAGSLDEDGARLTVSLTEDRERHSRLAADCQREAELPLRRRRWALAPRPRREARADATQRADRAAYHVLGAPGIASLTAACLTSDRAIDLGQLQELVKNGGEARQWLLFAVAAELYGREEAVSLSELLAGLNGEDLDRVLDAIAVLKRRRITIPGSAGDLWIRAAEPK
jgi:hypothetical protein